MQYPIGLVPRENKRRKPLGLRSRGFSVGGRSWRSRAGRGVAARAGPGGDVARRSPPFWRNCHLEGYRNSPLPAVIATWRGIGIPLFPPFSSLGGVWGYRSFPPFLPFGGVWGHPFWFRLNPRLQGLGKVR